MCGIAGYFGTETLQRDRIEACLKVMHQRGPDDTSFRQLCVASDKHLSLLHSRLSIIDLNDRANQPFKMGSKWLVYNGELYNYLELRAELIRLGYEFKTESDTEVLLRVIDHYGWKGLDKCEGMWAFALYDEQTKILTLSRDRFGEKPLYLYQSKTGIFFGSEIRFMNRLASQKFNIDQDHLFRYMVNGSRSLYKKRKTFFIDVTEVPAGAIVHIDENLDLKTTSYWTPKISVNESLSYNDAVASVKEQLISTVKLRLRSDVPLAFCMSGGVDSNTLISIAKRVLNYDVHGFTIQNKDARYDEEALVDQTVKELQIRHTYVPVKTSEFIPKLTSLIQYRHAPVYTITWYAQWLLLQSIAEQGYKISLSGIAADELFSGYYDHHNAYLYEMRNDAERYKNYLTAWTKHVQPGIRNQYLRDPRVFIKNPSMRDHLYLNADAFSSYMVKPWKESFVEEAYCDDLLRNRMLNETFHENVPVYLHEDDLNAMFYSIENRTPFLDRNLFELCHSIPTRHLCRDGYAKAILRDAMKGIVPDAIIYNHTKVGFNASIFSFLDVKDPEVKSYLLDQSPIFDLVKRDKIEQLFIKEQLPNSESKFLFYFLNAKIFLESFI